MSRARAVYKQLNLFAPLDTETTQVMRTWANSQRERERDCVAHQAVDHLNNGHMESILP